MVYQLEYFAGVESRGLEVLLCFASRDLCRKHSRWLGDDPVGVPFSLCKLHDGSGPLELGAQTRGEKK